MSLSIIVMGASGRMGTTIANLAKEQGMTLAAVLERPERLDALAHWGCLAGTDPEVVYPQVPGAVVIDFTAPEASLANARCAVKNGNPIVIGTTGFTPEQKAELDAIAQNGRVFWSPNMSVGVNVLLELLPELVQMLGPDYDLEMVELHHNRKKDSPRRCASPSLWLRPEIGTSRMLPATTAKASSESAPRRKSAFRPSAAVMWSACIPSISWAPESALR